MDDFSGFDDSTQMFAWATAPPSEIIRFYIEDAVKHARPGSIVDRIICSEKPRYLSGAKKQDDDPGHVILARVGAVFTTELYLTTAEGNRESHRGVSTLICQNLDQPGEQTIRLQFTPGGDIEELESALAVEIYSDDFNTD